MYILYQQLHETLNKYNFFFFNVLHVPNKYMSVIMYVESFNAGR